MAEEPRNLKEVEGETYCTYCAQFTEGEHSHMQGRNVNYIESQKVRLFLQELFQERYVFLSDKSIKIPGRVDRLCELTWIARKILGGAVDCAEDPDCEKCPNAKCIKEDECDHCFCPKECPGYIGEPNGG